MCIRDRGGGGAWRSGVLACAQASPPLLSSSPLLSLLFVPPAVLALRRELGARVALLRCASPAACVLGRARARACVSLALSFEVAFLPLASSLRASALCWSSLWVLCLRARDVGGCGGSMVCVCLLCGEERESARERQERARHADGGTALSRDGDEASSSFGTDRRASLSWSRHHPNVTRPPPAPPRACGCPRRPLSGSGATRSARGRGRC
jgi:hypothetical protein